MQPNAIRQPDINIPLFTAPYTLPSTWSSGVKAQFAGGFDPVIYFGQSGNNQTAFTTAYLTPFTLGSPLEFGTMTGSDTRFHMVYHAGKCFVFSNLVNPNTFTTLPLFPNSNSQTTPFVPTGSQYYPPPAAFTGNTAFQTEGLGFSSGNAPFATMALGGTDSLLFSALFGITFPIFGNLRSWTANGNPHTSYVCDYLPIFSFPGGFNNRFYYGAGNMNQFTFLEWNPTIWPDFITGWNYCLTPFPGGSNPGLFISRFIIDALGQDQFLIPNMNSIGVGRESVATKIIFDSSDANMAINNQQYSVYDTWYGGFLLDFFGGTFDGKQSPLVLLKGDCSQWAYINFIPQDALAATEVSNIANNPTSDGLGSVFLKVGSDGNFYSSLSGPNVFTSQGLNINFNPTIFNFVPQPINIPCWSPCLAGNIQVATTQ